MSNEQDLARLSIALTSFLRNYPDHAIVILLKEYQHWWIANPDLANNLHIGAVESGDATYIVAWLGEKSPATIEGLVAGLEEEERVIDIGDTDSKLN